MYPWHGNTHYLVVYEFRSLDVRPPRPDVKQQICYLEMTTYGW